MKDISLSEKLILYFMLLGFGAIVLVSVFSFYSTKDALLARTFDQLISLRIVKKNQIEAFFNDRCREVLLVANSTETKKISGLLKEPVNGIPHQLKSDSFLITTSLRSYQNKFRGLGKYFSRIIISGTSGKKIIICLTDDSHGVSALFNTAENRCTDSILQKKMQDPGKVFITDEINPGGGGDPVVYIGTPVTDVLNSKEVFTGMIVVEVPVAKINAIMLNNNPQSGLGSSGETYLVGKDFRMRSQSRFLNCSVLNTLVNTEAARDGFSGHGGTIITRDYRDIQVLSAYSKIVVPGIDWVILAEIDLKEAMIPIYRMRNTIVVLSTALAMIFFILVLIFSRRLTKPIIQLKDAAIKIGGGNYETILPVTSHDEIGSLTQSFNLMTAQIKEKTDELRLERMGRLRSVIDAEETERQRLSREIHDGIGQSLIALKLRLEGLLYTEEKDLKGNIKILKDQFDGTVDEIRRISNNLMPSVLEAFGITIALRNLCDETEEHSGIQVKYCCDGDLESLSTRIKTYLFRIAQEAINNIIKHSMAKTVSLTVCRKEDLITFTITDDGKGFNVDGDSQEKGNGLHNMRERVALMAGTIDIQSVINKGTTITIKVPAY